MTQVSALLVLAFVAVLHLVPLTSCFSIHPNPPHQRISTHARASVETELEAPPTAAIPIPSMSSKFFQLEEREHSESSTTEIFLRKDGSVSLAESDGPPPLQASGTWIQNGDKLEMRIERIFVGGHKGTDIGEFHFKVERTYRGNLSFIGNTILMEGSMHLVDDVPQLDFAVGFFSIIDTTNVRLGEEEKSLGFQRTGRVTRM
mmetsp:Transcript_13562/g.19836  ORF Transcript_13562/g.19836 Transcript_13562/m.19836 type:complete len:203 (-) Transcript_13562:124-732(-)|eukprot:CAMPEP_0197241488 /NCGR_PEP_ID=MMETSP1429-20130617/7504_1 /TAXON_ID=49237 /ORGANISM="Chaetoceros  sp., Strain UNC1202" /LENGTH=202 /DNA_ID=CAMNT_0042701331 /DNA_START=98 /DNA_END=706 /DNA_ORIENTATION=-